MLPTLQHVVNVMSQSKTRDLPGSDSTLGPGRRLLRGTKIDDDSETRSVLEQYANAAAKSAVRHSSVSCTQTISSDRRRRLEPKWSP
ncbi:hypothetical protein VTI74DRAFT_8411 [Chaetomium olivicolor]